MKKITKAQVTQGLRWSVFIMAALTMSIKIAEVSAYNSFKMIIENPEIAQYSTLVNSGYLFIK
ncbi:MAG: hypothetical protein QM490_01215 [Candidatus Gracilibacteria bacterium]